MASPRALNPELRGRRRSARKRGDGPCRCRLIREAPPVTAPHAPGVHAAKTALGERGTPWWEQSDEQRRTRWSAAVPDRRRERETTAFTVGISPLPTTTR